MLVILVVAIGTIYKKTDYNKSIQLKEESLKQK
jgi:hypothetical protein